MSYCTRLEAQNVDKYITFVDFKAQEAPFLTDLRGRVGPLKQIKHPRIGGFTCLEGSGRLNVSYFTCLEAQNFDKLITFA